MSCCCPHSRSAGRLFSVFARRYRKRFEKRGFEGSQHQLLEGLTRAGFQAASVLEIGSGVGHLQQTLLERGAATGVGVELAPRMIEEARRWADERGLAARTKYIEGDFMALSATIDAAEVVVLDKVVCCYPDADGLVHRSLGKSTRVYALTYPRNVWYVRLAVAVGAALMKVIGSDFRPYVHDPQRIQEWIADDGLVPCYQAMTPVWLTQVYVRERRALSAVAGG